MDTQQNVDRCKFGDVEGKILYQADYVTCDLQSAVPEERLRLKPSTSTFIYLQDGTMLIERSWCQAHNPSANPQ
jgi:hypothetical protein